MCTETNKEHRERTGEAEIGKKGKKRSWERSSILVPVQY